MMSSGEMVFQNGPIDGVVIRPLARFEDARGWLVELYREDQLEPARHPVMAYASQTLPGVARGPHEHREQTDYFAFFGPGDFKVYLWDARPGEPTFGHELTLVAGQSEPAGRDRPARSGPRLQKRQPCARAGVQLPEPTIRGRGQEGPGR